MTIVIGIDPHKASHTATAIGPGSVEGRHDQPAGGPLDAAGVVELGGPVARASLGD